MDFLEPRAEGVAVRVRVQPRASRSEIAGQDEQGQLRVRIAAPPVEGAANEAAVELLAKTLGVAKSSVRLLRGQKSRVKEFLIRGIDAETARAALIEGRPSRIGQKAKTKGRNP